MRVAELAEELKVPTDALLGLLRSLGIAARAGGDRISEQDAAVVRTKVERELRAGKKTPLDAVVAATEESRPSTRRRRRRADEEAEGADSPESSEAETSSEGPGIEAQAPEAASAAPAAASPSAPSETASPPSAEEPSKPVAPVENAPASLDEGAGSSATTKSAPSDAPASQKPLPVSGSTPSVAPKPAAAKPVAPVAPSHAPGAQTPAPSETDTGAAPQDASAGRPTEPQISDSGASAAASGTDASAGQSAPSGEAPATAETAPDSASVVAGKKAGIPSARSMDPNAPPPAAAGAAPAASEEGSADGRPIRRLKPQAARVGGAPAVPVRPMPAASAGPGGQVRIQADGYTADGRKKDKKKGKKKGGVDSDVVQDNVQRVMAEIRGGGGKKRRKKGNTGPTREELENRAEEARVRSEEEAKTVRVNEFLTVAELSELIDISSAQLVGAAFKNLGMMVTINQRLDFDQIELLLDEFNFKAVREEAYAEDEVEEEIEAEVDLMPRPPVVTVMGHVDHGKTLLLDSIRKTNVVAGESGGITQHIGAYHVNLEDGRAVTFLDTPGHAAFTAMRARGADITDIVILMVAADDSIMPQTIEAISHAKNAGVPMVVAINKVDLPTANPDRVKQQLLQHEVMVEDYGGDVLCAEVSAKTGQGIDDLLEKILLQAEILEIKANPNRAAQGAVIESKLDVGKGAVVTVLVQKGTLRVGDSFLCGMYDGRVRAMLDERGRPVAEAGPGIPVQILGSGGVPQAGDTLQAMDAVRAAEVSQTRQRLEREKQLRIKDRGLKLGDFAAFMGRGEVSVLPLIVKADVDGSIQAVADSLEQLSTSEVRVEIIHRAVGAINESDVLLAETAKAVVIGFRVRPDSNARALAEQNGVDLRLYEVIYEAVDEVKLALEGLLSPEQRERILGTAEVREVFRISKVGAIAGSYVTSGIMDRKAKARLIRDGIVVYTGDFASLKRFKDDVREVRDGFECGIGIVNFNDLKVGDVIECFTVEEFARTLAGSGGGRDN
jgi:translation initiation factor IF-2